MTPWPLCCQPQSGSDHSWTAQSHNQASPRPSEQDILTRDRWLSRPNSSPRDCDKHKAPSAICICQTHCRQSCLHRRTSTTSAADESRVLSGLLFDRAQGRIRHKSWHKNCSSQYLCKAAIICRFYPKHPPQIRCLHRIDGCVRPGPAQICPGLAIQPLPLPDNIFCTDPCPDPDRLAPALTCCCLCR